MFELDCTGVIPGCERVIRAESEGEVIRRATVQAREFGFRRITPAMMDKFREQTKEAVN